MSLLARAQSTQEKAGTREGREERFTSEALRRSLGAHLSFDDLAAMIGVNPERAQGEVKAAARRVFSEHPWRRLTEATQQKLLQELIDSIFGLGPLEPLLADESVTEIMVNGTQSVFYERGGQLFRSGAVFESEDQVRLLIDRIIGPLGRRIDESSPMVNGRLPEGHRVHAIIPPLALDGPMLTLRIFTRHVMALGEMMERGSFGLDVATLLTWAVRYRKSIAVSGGTGSGKTTLLNALSCLIPPSERIITIEDSAELRFLEHPHVVRLEARPLNAEGVGEITIRDLVINALRMRPDRIVVGECRGGEALDMLQAMNSGHEGSLTTLHANAPFEAIERLVTMVRYAVDLPVDAIEAQIGSAFSLIVQTARAREGQRYIACIAEVSFDRSQRRCVITPLYERNHATEQGRWYKAPAWVQELPCAGIASAKEVSSWMRSLSLAEER